MNALSFIKKSCLLPVLSCAVLGVQALAQSLPFDTVEGFDNLPLGAITRGTTAYGTLTAETGHAEITNIKCISKPYCIHLKGNGAGNTRQFNITFPSALTQETAVSFKAERFTRDGVFQFRVYSVDGNGSEVEIINGDTVVTGTFPNTLSGVLPAGTKGIVFKIVAFPEKGVLIEDLVIHKSLFETTAQVWPAVIGKEGNGILRINPNGISDPQDLSFTVDMSPTENLDDIESVCIQTGNANNVYYFPGYSNHAVTTTPAPKFSADAKPAALMTFTAKDGFTMNSTLPYLWVSVKLKPSASLDRKVGCKLVKITYKGTEYPVDDVVSLQRIGFSVAKTGDLVYGKPSPRGKASKKFRIPGIVRAQNGDLVAVFDARYDNRRDMADNIHVAMRRSSDNGQTWSRIEVAMNYTGTKGNPKPSGNVDYSAAYGVGDPAILVDDVTGYLWVTGIAKFGLSSSAGYTDATTSQFAMAFSTDHGKTWSEITSLNFQCKDQSWTSFFAGPGHGITMKDRGNGIRRIVFPAQIWKGSGWGRSCLVYSDDHGKTWKCEEQGKTDANIGVKLFTSESSIVELKDGSLMLNVRNQSGTGRGYRGVYVTNNMGKTWTAHSTNLNTLPEPICQGNILAVENVGNVERMLVFTNPNVVPSTRMNMTLKASFDEGKTWPANNQVLYDSRPSCGYSDICLIDDKYIGVLYEALDADEDLYFLRIPLDELLPTLQATRMAAASVEESQDLEEAAEEAGVEDEIQIAQFTTPSDQNASNAKESESANNAEEASANEDSALDETTGETAPTADAANDVTEDATPAATDTTPVEDSPADNPETRSTEIIAQETIREEQAVSDKLGTEPAYMAYDLEAADSYEWLDINSNSTWLLSSNVAWLRPQKSVGVGNARVKIVIKANTRPVARQGVITLRTAGKKPINIVVTQRAN